MKLSPHLSPARLVAVVLACLVAMPAHATTYRLMPVPTVIGAADLVFLGTVTDVVTEVRNGTPWTLVSLRVDDLYRGFGYDPAAFESRSPLDDAPDWQDPAFAVPEVVTLAFLGGETTAGDTLLVSGSLSWRFDASYLVAAYQREGLASPVVGFRQGVWQRGDDAFVAHDGSFLTVGADGLPERGPVGASPSQVTRAVRAVLAGGLVPGREEADGEATGQLPGEAGTAQPTDPDNEGGEAMGPVPQPDSPRDAAGGAQGSAPADGAPQAGGQEAASLVPGPIVAAYDVDDSGGPLLLSERVARAAEAWRAAAAGVVAIELAQREDARAVLRYGPADLLGPDTLSLTTVAGDGTLTAYLSPGAGALLDTVIVHELGLVLGATEGDEGVMAFAVAGAFTAPSPSDVQALRLDGLYQPADLTRDGNVDFYDLVALAEAYGTTGINVAGDLDGDGDVDDDDVAALRAQYTFGTPAPGAVPPDGESQDTR